MATNQVVAGAAVQNPPFPERGAPTQPPFNLRRYFTLASFFAVFVGVLLFSLLQTRATQSLLIARGEAAALVAASSLVFQIHREFVEPLEAQGQTVDLAEADQYELLDSVVRHSIATLPVIKVNIFDHDGRVIYSTARETVGRLADHHSRVRFALRGEFSSVLKEVNKPGDPISGPPYRALLETYIPMSRMAEASDLLWPDMAVFETYQDASPTLATVRSTTRRAMLQSCAVGLLAFGLLYSIVRRADTLLRRQYDQLQRWNSELEDRVAIRTAELQRSSESLERLFNGITDGISVLSRDLHVLQANTPLRQLSDPVYRTAWEHKPCYQLYARRDSPCIGCPVPQTLDTRTAATVGMTWEIDGELRHFEITTFPFTPGPDAETRIIEYVRDVTDRRRAEQQLIHAGRLASIGVLASGVAHEINNPLGSVAQCLAGLRDRVIEDGYHPDPEVREYFEIITRELRRCKGITRTLLDFARQTQGRETIINLAQLIHDAHLLLRNRFKTLRVQWAPDIPAEGICLVADSAKLQQIIFNLLHNALDACADTGGAVSCVARVEEENIVLEVCDTGVGMTPQVLDRIFEPFFTTKTVGQGTGLGLSVSFSLIQEMGGHLEASSPGPGLGSCFRLRLPVGARV